MSALHFIWDGPAKGAISEKDLLKLHARLMKGLLPRDKLGTYKNVANKVIDARKNPVYIPPVSEKAAPLTRGLLEWMNHKDTQRSLHPVLSAIVHHRLVSIHPFADGNGRTSRLLACWLLYRGGFDTQHLFAIDEYYEESRQIYYDKLQQARDLDGDLSYWLEYAAEGIVVALRKTKARIESLAIQQAFPRLRLTAKQEMLLRLLRGKAWISAADLAQTLDISRERMSELLAPFIKAGVVVREGQTRATIYRLSREKQT